MKHGQKEWANEMVADAIERVETNQRRAVDITFAKICRKKNRLCDRVVEQFKSRPDPDFAIPHCRWQITLYPSDAQFSDLWLHKGT
jgi:hypothetical protein